MRLALLTALILALLPATAASAHTRYCGHDYHWHWGGTRVQYIKSHESTSRGHVHVVQATERFVFTRERNYNCPRHPIG